jgi:alpha-ribazole phosphatase
MGLLEIGVHPYLMNGPRHRLMLIRHGDAGSTTKRYIGQMDTSLTKTGLSQAHSLARYLKMVRIERIVCSDLLRCRHTAEIISAPHALPVETSVGLREIALGAWDGRSFEEIMEEDPASFRQRGLDLAGFRPPGGESFSDLQARVVPVFEDILARTAGTVIVVGHAGVNRVVLCHWLGIPLSRMFLLGQDPGAFSILEPRAGGSMRLLVLNQVPCSLGTEAGENSTALE